MRRFFGKTLPRFLLRALPFLTVAAVLISLLCYPRTKEETEARAPCVVRIWNVDTFEGGKGSRTAFLERVARGIEKQEKDLYYLVTAYTREGALAALENGDAPDMLSFGIGLSEFSERFLPLSYSFAGGEADGACLAYPWCAGRYSLFSLSEDFEEAGETVLSCGGYNLPEVAAYLAGIEGLPRDSTAAYVDFLNGKFRYLLGTQRDECRFAVRGVTVYRKDLPAYCDLYQYFAVLSAEKGAGCRLFLETLLSEETQNRLSEIGMFSCRESVVQKTVSAFSDQAALSELSELARSKSEGKKIDNYLKKI